MASSLLENPIVRSYIFYGSLLGLKMLAMSALTARIRLTRKVFVNPEDASFSRVKIRTDDDVERVRRAHLNDLENIPVFFLAAALYITTNPALYLANNLFKAYTIARYLHTLVYAVYVVPQPARVIAWSVGYGITGYMLVQSLLHYW